jgi:hypothetical protein
MDKFRKVALAELEPLMNGIFFGEHEDTLDANSLAAVFSALQFLEKEVEDRKEDIRAKLLELAEKKGTSTDKGGQILKTKYGTVTREKRQAKTPSEDAVKTLLAEHNLKLEAAFSERKTLVLDPSKLQMLVERGKLSKDEIESKLKVTWALKFKPNEATAEILESTIAAMDTE